MVILGIDPGTAITGYGIVSNKSGNLEMIDFGCINTSPKTIMPDRLVEIHSGMNRIINKYKPDVVACEELFFFKNLKTAITVAQARGVVLTSARLGKIPVAEYTPLQVKQAISGYGRADKKQMQKMVKVILNLDIIPEPDDAADALAVAICHASSEKFLNLKSG